MTGVTQGGVDGEFLGCFPSLSEKDRAVKVGSDVPLVYEQLEDGDGFFGGVEEPAVVSHEVSDGDAGWLGSADPVDNLFCFGCGFVYSPAVGDGEHVVEVVVAEFDGVGHGLVVDVGAWLVPGDVEEAGESEDVGTEFADPFGEVF